MKLLKEFKEFAVKGNMIEMAIGIIIGASFNKVIDVLVKQVFLPPISLLTNGVNFEQRRIILRDAVLDAEGGVLIDFLIIGFTVFIVVKFMNRLKNRAHDSKDKTVATPKDIELLTNLNELMKEQNKLIKTSQKYK